MAGIEFFDGAMSVANGVGSADPDSPKTTSGGPIESADGLDDGHSMTVPGKTDNMVDKPANKGGDIISGPMDV